jgi:predicted AlkP superfamily phosphohydrolase/phosphomutase
MIAQGQLPHIQKLLSVGAAGDLKSLSARKKLSRSPEIWTSIATGQTSDKHGIKGFTQTDPATGIQRFYRSDQRRSPALWNIFSDAGLSVGVVGWWVTWPAEKVRGTMVSYDFWPSRRFVAEDGVQGVFPNSAPYSVFPDTFTETLSKMIVLENQLTEPDRILLDEKRVENPVYYWPYARDLTMFRVADYLFARSRYDFFTVYFESLDIASHKGWRAVFDEDFYDPDEGSWKNFSPDKKDRTAGRLKRCYAMIDRFVGRFMESADDNTLLVVLSDHGFQTYQDLREKEHRMKKVIYEMSEQEKKDRGIDYNSFGHSDNGVLLVSGKMVRPGRIQGATIYDVAPTLLYAAGLPVPRDMDGRVLKNVFTDEFNRDRKIIRTGAVKAPPIPGDIRLPDEYEKDLKERLQSLGYLKD